MIALSFIKEGHPKTTVLGVLGIARSSFYYKAKENGVNRKGIPKSKYTRTGDGRRVSNEQVVKDIEEILLEEFV